MFLQLVASEWYVARLENAGSRYTEVSGQNQASTALIPGNNRGTY